MLEPVLTAINFGKGSAGQNYNPHKPSLPTPKKRHPKVSLTLRDGFCRFQPGLSHDPGAPATLQLDEPLPLHSRHSHDCRIPLSASRPPQVEPVSGALQPKPRRSAGDARTDAHWSCQSSDDKSTSAFFRDIGAFCSSLIIVIIVLIVIVVNLSNSNNNNNIEGDSLGEASRPRSQSAQPTLASLKKATWAASRRRQQMCARRQAALVNF